MGIRLSGSALAGAVQSVKTLGGAPKSGPCPLERPSPLSAIAEAIPLIGGKSTPTEPMIAPAVLEGRFLALRVAGPALQRGQRRPVILALRSCKTA